MAHHSVMMKASSKGLSLGPKMATTMVDHSALWKVCSKDPSLDP
jgi:hypothetical protein